jgi:hyperosmotically inducible protein
MVNFKRFHLIILALLLALAMSAGARDVSGTAQQNPLGKDEILSQELQHTLSDRVDLRNVAVYVDDRVATLQGTVETYRDKLEAERLVRKHKGIEGVRDFIAVKPLLSIDDRKLREDIANRLRYDRIGFGIMFNNFEVSVKDGVVTVRGEARSYPDKASALAIVQDTPGVRDVRDEINVLPLSAFDDELRLRTAMAIYRDPTLEKYASDPQAPIRIVVEHGNVKLYGVVDSALDKQIAEMKAKQVSGVFSVENYLLVANERGEKLAEGKSDAATSQQ